jgi:hypothetical protein
MTTLAELLDTTGLDVLEHLDRDADIPVVTMAACQGDVSILRAGTGAPQIAEDAVPVPTDGVAVVAGEAGGNTHSLHGDGPIYYDAAAVAGDSLTLGTLRVPEGSQAFMLHPEHGGFQINPGTYTIGRQREMADEIRTVAD